MRNSNSISNFNPSKNALFIHIPKNAGTSVCTALGIKKCHHYFLSDYEKQIGTKKLGRITTIAFTRNPWDRFISLYNYARMQISHYHNNIEPQKGIYGAHPDYEILKNSTPRECARLLVEGKLHLPNWNIWLPQSTWLKDSFGNLKKPTFLGRFENLNTDFEEIRSILDLETTIPHINQSKKSCYRECFDSETREIVSSYYQEDIERFNYKF